MKNINIEEFQNKFNEEYDIIYNCQAAGVCVAGYDEAVEEFDRMIKIEWFKKFVGEFVKYRGDFVSSDREAAAFMFALTNFE